MGDGVGRLGSGDGEPGTVSVLTSSSRTRLVLEGDIDVRSKTELMDAVGEALEIGRPVELDVRHVTFLDSSAMSALARLTYRLPSRPQIIAPSELMRFLLDVTHLGDDVDVLDHDPGFGESVTV